nr:hypothetical protein CFP56_78252 [Quercus suber]
MSLVAFPKEIRATCQEALAPLGSSSRTCIQLCTVPQLIIASSAISVQHQSLKRSRPQGIGTPRTAYQTRSACASMQLAGQPKCTDDDKGIRSGVVLHRLGKNSGTRDLGRIQCMPRARLLGDAGVPWRSWHGHPDRVTQALGPTTTDGAFFINHRLQYVDHLLRLIIFDLTGAPIDQKTRVPDIWVWLNKGTTPIDLKVSH